MATFIVDILADVDDGDTSAGNLSLREAIGLANGNVDADTIEFAAGLAGGTITLTGEASLTNDVTIDGDIDSDDEADITLSGGDAVRILDMSGSGTEVTLLSLTLTDGNAGDDNGGAIYVDGIQSLTIVDSTISSSSAAASGGGSYYGGGGIYAYATDLRITNSLIVGNSSGAYGGGVYAANSLLVVTNSTIHGNSAADFGGGLTIAYGTDATILNSTITANDAGNGGGGIENYGSSLTMLNSVVAGNTAGSFTAVIGSVDVAVNNFFDVDVVLGPGNEANFNIIGGGDPLLGALLDNGGTVLTRSPLDGSPLIDAGDDSLLPPDDDDLDGDGDVLETLPEDGREGSRIVGGSVDIGAVEQIVDEIIGGTGGDDSIIGGLGHDFLAGRAGLDTLDGGDGEDVLAGDSGADLMLGGAGFDRVSYRHSGAGIVLDLADTRNNTGDAAGDSYDSIESFAGTELGDDTLSGDTGAEIFYGVGGADTLIGLTGGDRLHGGDGADTLDGGDDADRMFGDAGADSLLGGGGIDTLVGGDDADTLAGGGDNDVLIGEAGADRLIGGAGRDRLFGGADADVFAFELGDTGATATTRDAILDFQDGSDLIDLSGLGLTFVTAYTGAGAELRVVVGASYTLASIDTDGDKLADMQILIQGLTTGITAADFVL